MPMHDDEQAESIALSSGETPDATRGFSFSGTIRVERVNDAYVIVEVHGRAPRGLRLDDTMQIPVGATATISLESVSSGVHDAFVRCIYYDRP
jgi:hypothetical protein